MLPKKPAKAFFLLLLLYACAGKQEKISVESSIAAASISADTISSLPARALFPVYKLTPGITAIVIALHDRLESTQTFFDTAVNTLAFTDGEHLAPAGSEFVDTSGEYRLMENKILSGKVRNHIAPSYFVYGTKGAAKMPVTKTLLALDECKTSIIALTIPLFDTARLGIPLFCADRPLEIHYNNDYSPVELQINRLQKAEQSDYDYLDKIPIKVFGNMGAAYFAYSDDFMWERAKPEQKCFFPSRYIFTKNKNGSLKRSWIADLDLFGIPCD